MTIANNTIINGTFDLSTLISTNPIDQPVNFIALFNELLGGYIVVSILLVLGVIVFLISRSVTQDDLRASIQASFISSFVGLLVFLVEVTGVTGVDKLLTFGQLTPFLVVFAGLLFYQWSTSNY